MKIWKSRKIHPKSGIWASEVRLREVSNAREKAVEKLLKLLEKEGFDATLS